MVFSSSLQHSAALGFNRGLYCPNPIECFWKIVGTRLTASRLEYHLCAGDACNFLEARGKHETDGGDNRYSRLVFSLAVRIVGERALAEEITADAFVRVWRSASSFAEERGRFVAWLMSVTRHRAIDELRRLSVRPEGSSVELNEALNTVHPYPLEEVVDVRRRRELVRSALATFPAPQRGALELAYFGGLTQQEIAEKTGTPLGTVKTRMRLGMLKMRDELRRLDKEIE